MIKTIINLCCKVSKLRRENKRLLCENITTRRQLTQVSKLRRENKRLLCENITTCRQLTQAISLIDSYQKSLHEAKSAYFSTFMFTVPQSNVYRMPARIGEPYRDLCAEAHYAERKERKLTDKQKIEMFDQLLQQGFIRRYETDTESTRYEIRVVRP